MKATVRTMLGRFVCSSLHSEDAAGATDRCEQGGVQSRRRPLHGGGPQGHEAHRSMRGEAEKSSRVGLATGGRLEVPGCDHCRREGREMGVSQGTTEQESSWRGSTADDRSNATASRCGRSPAGRRSRSTATADVPWRPGHRPAGQSHSLPHLPCASRRPRWRAQLYSALPAEARDWSGADLEAARRLSPTSSISRRFSASETVPHRNESIGQVAFNRCAFFNALSDTTSLSLGASSLHSRTLSLIH